MVCIFLSLIRSPGVRLRLEGGSVAQQFKRSWRHHPVSQSPGRLQDRTDATELGQVHHAPAHYAVTLTLLRNTTLIASGM